MVKVMINGTSDDRSQSMIGVKHSICQKNWVYVPGCGVTVPDWTCAQERQQMAIDYLRHLLKAKKYPKQHKIQITWNSKTHDGPSKFRKLWKL
jgi:hypothetical protein